MSWIGLTPDGSTLVVSSVQPLPKTTLSVHSIDLRRCAVRLLTNRLTSVHQQLSNHGLLTVPDQADTGPHHHLPFSGSPVGLGSDLAWSTRVGDKFALAGNGSGIYRIELATAARTTLLACPSRGDWLQICLTAQWQRGPADAKWSRRHEHAVTAAIDIRSARPA